MKHKIQFIGPGDYLTITDKDIKSDIFEMFDVSVSENKGAFKNQVIVHVKDQAELSGFLLALYNMHYTIIKLERTINQII